MTAASRILVVEDDDDLRAMLAEVLTGEGFQVSEARNGREALDQLNNGDRPAAILLDHIMPVMDAMSFLQERAQRPTGPRIPVILLTALDPTKLDWPAGVDRIDVHTKPVDVAALVTTLRRLCA